MKYMALVSFSGVVSMAMGEVREISDPLIAKDLLRAGHIMKVTEPKTEQKAKPKRRGKTQ